MHKDGDRVLGPTIDSPKKGESYGSVVVVSGKSFIGCENVNITFESPAGTAIVPISLVPANPVKSSGDPLYSYSSSATFDQNYNPLKVIVTWAL